ncbi:MAG: hypothetical protein ACRCYY_03560 [Trueperaceae bacterium]
MSDVLGQVFGLISVAVIGIIVLLVLAPLETLGWWTGFYNRYDKDLTALPDPHAVVVPFPQPASHYIIFLDGIAKAGQDNYEDVELFLERLQQQLPRAVVIGSVLPYSVTNRPLTSARPLARFWRWAKQRKLGNTKDLIGFSINVRNMFQVLVSADSRYGPIYNLGAARLIIEPLLQKGYPVGSGLPVTLIGYSGGAQVAAGATPYIKELLRAPVDLISLAGVISADPGLNDVRFLYHLAGSKDRVENIATLLCPGRWPVSQNSSWNRAKRKGKFTYVPMGPMFHNGKHSYLDVKANLANGQSFLDHTVKTVEFVITQPEAVRARRIKKGKLDYLFDPGFASSSG